MELKGEYRIPASRQAVWEALNDPFVLKGSIAGCESFERIANTEFIAKVLVRIGGINARFSGRVSVSEIDAPNAYTLSTKGQGGLDMAKGSVRVTLEDAPDGGTLLRYAGQAEIGDKLAALGDRLVGGFVKSGADDFFYRLSAMVGGVATPAFSTSEAKSVSPRPPASKPDMRSSRKDHEIFEMPQGITPEAFPESLGSGDLQGGDGETHLKKPVLIFIGILLAICAIAYFARPTDW